MNYVKKIGQKVFGDEKEPEFQSTKWANCLVAVPKDTDKLVINKKAMESVHKHFGRVVSLVGRPGVGKSTLASSIYNLMRGDKTEYFEISGCMQSFTKGIWSLNEHYKVLKADRDSKYGVDILDLEGLANSNSIHYLVVIAMALSDGLVLCDLGKRFNFDALDTILAGIRIYREKKINLPPPTIYLQVKYGKKKFKINTGMRKDREGFIEWIKNTYPELKGFDVRLFSTNFVKPDGDSDEDTDSDEDEGEFKQNPRFESAYTQSVHEFVTDIQSIPPRNVAIEDRVKYAMTMVDALNSNSPDMIVKLNFKFFTDEVNQIAKQAESKAIKRIKLEAESTTNTVNKKLTFDEFCRLICENGTINYGKTIQQQAMALSFYDPKDAQYANFVEQYQDSKKYSIYAKTYCQDNYESAMTKVKSVLIAKGGVLMKENDKAFKEFVDYEVNRAINSIKFNGYTGLSYKVRMRVQEKSRLYRKEIIQQTQQTMELPDDYLSINILTKQWESKINRLKADWEDRKTVALGAGKRKVTTSGDHRCPKCGNDHSPGVGHKKCGRGALWYWVDAETNCCICDRCKELCCITSVCCWSCSTTLKAKVVPIGV